MVVWCVIVLIVFEVCGVLGFVECGLGVYVVI